MPHLTNVDPLADDEMLRFDAERMVMDAFRETKDFKTAVTQTLNELRTARSVAAAALRGKDADGRA